MQQTISAGVDVVGQAGCQACTDTAARTPINPSGIFDILEAVVRSAEAIVSQIAASHRQLLYTLGGGRGDKLVIVKHIVECSYQLVGVIFVV